MPVYTVIVRHVVQMARQKAFAMFTFVAATLFSAAFLLAIGTIVWMFAHYHDKMAAALQFEPMPQEPQVYHIHIRRSRVLRMERRAALPLPTGVLAA